MNKPVFVWQNRRLKKIDPLEIAFIETDKNYTRICFADSTCFMVRSTLLNTLKNLPPDIFIQTHRAYAVSVFYIDDIGKDQLVIGDTAIPIARQYYDSVIAQLQIIS